jgi:hypothetical protein
MLAAIGTAFAIVPTGIFLKAGRSSLSAVAATEIPGLRASSP